MPDFTCETCGAPFKAHRRRARFCSMACYAAHRVGPNHPGWKGGGRRPNAEGYVRVVVYPDHPRYGMARRHSGRSRELLEHRLVMAEHMGRDLLPTEYVHHRNGDKADNRLSNLELRVDRHGKGATEPHCASCTCFAS